VYHLNSKQKNMKGFSKTEVALILTNKELVIAEPFLVMLEAGSTTYIAIFRKESRVDAMLWVY
jgi:hypothetical protein